MKIVRQEPEHVHDDICRAVAEAEASARIRCHAEDVEFDPSKAMCAGLVEIGTELQDCSSRAEWWVGDSPSCSSCIGTFVNDEGPTVIVPITEQPVPPSTDCLAHRCVKHIQVPIQNQEENGAECGGCIAARVAELEALINTPEVYDFTKAVDLEAAHQVERWGVDHDAGKTDADWFWLIGYLGTKALLNPAPDHAPWTDPERTEKKLHRIITVAAAAKNWYRHVTGANTRMRPGIEPPPRGEAVQ